MKKVSIIILSRDADSCIKAIRRLGALHVWHTQTPQGKDIIELKEDIDFLSQAAGILSRKELPGQRQTEFKDYKQVSRHIVDIHKRIERLQEYARHISSQIIQGEPWGEFDPYKIKDLREKGIFIKLYQIPEKEIKQLPEGLAVKNIFTQGGISYCIIISREDFSLAFKEIALPQSALSELKKKLAEEAKTKDRLKQELTNLSAYGEFFIETREKLLNELVYQEALKGMGQAGQLSYIIGFVPRTKVEPLLKLAKSQKWAIVISEPSDEDIVPTLLENPKWVDLISPIFKLLEVIPGYKEIDISLLFLVFFSIFFGMIIGDAGYGAVYLLLTAVAHKKFSRKLKDRSAFALFYVLSSCAIIWGLFTGTIFGQEWFLKAGMAPLIPALNNTKFLQSFCFFLGAFHLTLAHGWKALIQLPALTACAEAGWIAVIWTGFLLAKTLILGDAFPWFGNWLLYSGIALVIFCSSPEKNILKAIGKGIAAVALSLVNNFTDVVSYIRLFAVGLAGVAIADTVNNIAAGIGGLAQVLILIAGHSINIALGPMSVLVHGIRLNVLEFSGHAGVAWSGIRYKPLSEE